MNTNISILRPNTELQGGRYRIIKTLGQGGFGITYLAEQVMTERKVCIKEFFPKGYYTREGDSSAVRISSQEFTENMGRFKTKFIKESKTIAALDHPNIIHIFDAFEENNTAYYIMEYIEGESLNGVVKRLGALTEGEAVAYIRQVASALEHIHAKQIMHLDVKPGNIMVRESDNRAILIDFGLSKHYDATSGEATSTTPVGISHGFAPMEQYKQGGVCTFSPETDIYSLGATLYYLVTGRVPLEAAEIADNGLPALPSHLSHGVRMAIERSMEDKRKNRPHSIKAFLELLDGDTPPPPPPPVNVEHVDSADVEGFDKTIVVTDSNSAYRVGDHYDENGREGVVFEVWDNGRHGKIVSLDETVFDWSSAHYWCGSKGTGWHMPTKEELQKIYSNKNLINTTLRSKKRAVLDGWYWSSVESDVFCAWFVDMSDGHIDDDLKCDDTAVRAVSTF